MVTMVVETAVALASAPVQQAVTDNILSFKKAAEAIII